MEIDSDEKRERLDGRLDGLDGLEELDRLDGLDELERLDELDGLDGLERLD